MITIRSSQKLTNSVPQLLIFAHLRQNLPHHWPHLYYESLQPSVRPPSNKSIGAQCTSTAGWQERFQLQNVKIRQWIQYSEKYATGSYPLLLQGILCILLAANVCTEFHWQKGVHKYTSQPLLPIIHKYRFCACSYCIPASDVITDITSYTVGAQIFCLAASSLQTTSPQPKVCVPQGVILCAQVNS